MNWLNFKSVIVLCLLGLSLIADAENNNRELSKKTGFLKKIIPSHSKLQYAGSMGMFSLGCGWSYGKKHWESDLLVGLAPVTFSYGNNFMLYVLTLKQNYFPWSLKINDRILFKPLSAGIYTTLVLNDDKEIWLTAPDKYDSGYYWHSNRMRFHVYLGESISFKLNTNKAIKSIDVFYEISTCDLYISKFLKDNYYDYSDILAASVGVRLSIR